MKNVRINSAKTVHATGGLGRGPVRCGAGTHGEARLTATEEAVTCKRCALPEPRTEGPVIGHGKREAAAKALMVAAGDFLEHWDEDLRGVDVETARELFGRWLRNLPGMAYDRRIWPHGRWDD